MRTFESIINYTVIVKMKRCLLVRMMILSFAVLGLVFTSCGKSEKEVGLQLYSLRDLIGKRPVGDVLDSVGTIGYKFVEAASYGDGKFYGMDPVQFKELCEKNGLAFISSHTGHDCPDDLSDAETWKWWEQCIDAHAKAGCKYLVQPWMGGKGYGSLEGLKQYCEYFNKVGEMCNAKGIRFGYHNHSGEFKDIDGQKIYDFMLNNTDPKKVMFEIDLYWATKGGVDPVDYFKKYPGRFELWHVKDVKEIGASGEMNFKKIYDNYNGCGVQYMIVEQEDYSYPYLESVRKSFEYLNNAEFVKASYSK